MPPSQNSLIAYWGAHVQSFHNKNTPLQVYAHRGEFLAFVKFCILLLSIEAGAELGDAGEVAVTYNLGLGIGSFQFFEQIPERLFLISSTGVSPAASFILAANVANADGMLIVILDMSTSELLGTAGMNGAILIDHPVVAAADPAFGLVPVIDVIDSDPLADLGVGAVDDNPLDILHGRQFHS